MDYVNHKKQFQVHDLLTEQYHPKTINLTENLTTNTTLGLQALLSVDADISQKFQTMAADPVMLAKLTHASEAIQHAILQHKKIYLYGTGSTGRLSKQIESCLWRPFWKKVASPFPDIENAVIGEMTGGDRALISSLEGFEDLALIGKLQLEEHHISQDDVVFAITESGETSAVIGTIIAAAEQRPKTNADKLFFIYNNPDELLMPFARSRAVLENEAIIKINLATGPQALAGSTRMQATTSELFIIGIIFEHAIQQLLQTYLSPEKLQQLGFDPHMSLEKRLLSFVDLQQTIYKLAPELSRLTDLEASTYAQHQHTTYLANKALLTAFTDVTERSPTFRVYPLDPINAAIKKSWIQVCAPVENQQTAWLTLLQRPFHGLELEHYKVLVETALDSLQKAGNEQQYLYDFSYSKTNIRKNDLGVLLLLANEQPTDAMFKQWFETCTQARAKLAVIAIAPDATTQANLAKINELYPHIVILTVPISTTYDPLDLNQHVALKMLLNSHSTAVMAKLGRVVGNTMTDVSPSNLKLIDRATSLIKTHAAVSYAEANAILFDILQYANTTQQSDDISEVAVAIVRIIASRKLGQAISWQAAITILQTQSLGAYLLG